MLRPLGRADTAEMLELLRKRPVHNVYLEYLVRLGALGSLPGFSGWFQDGALEATLLVASNGGTCLEGRNPDAFDELAAAAWDAPVRPRHIVGPEDVTRPFWEAYARFGVTAAWERREPVYVIGRESAGDVARLGEGLALEPARPRDLESVIENSARQYVEDLKVDRYGQDPDGFRERHRVELRDGRWWVARERGQVRFQLHVGPENDEVVQIGGVFTAPEVRGRGWATRGVAAACARLLDRVPGVSLFCDESNAAARTAYERVGFRQRFWYRSWLLS